LGRPDAHQPDKHVCCRADWRRANPHNLIGRPQPRTLRKAAVPLLESQSTANDGRTRFWYYALTTLGDSGTSLLRGGGGDKGLSIMSYTIAEGDVIEWTVKMNLYAQTVLNVHHFRAYPGFVEKDALDVFNEMNSELGTAGGAVVNLMRAATSVDLTFESCIFQKIYPIRYARAEYPYGVFGSDLAPANTANIAAVLTKQTDRATERGAHLHVGQTGSIHIPGIPNDKYALGSLNVDYKTDKLLPIGVELLTDWTEAFLEKMLYVLWHAGATPKSSDVVTEIFPQDTVRVMRRRTKGIGI